MPSPILFEDIFTVQQVDDKHFERVSRIECKSENFEMRLVLDVNTSIYPIEPGTKFSLALASTLDLQGNPGPDHYVPIKGPSLLDKYKYVMCGKIFDYVRDTSRGTDITILASYGGLLMELTGDPRNLTKLELDSKIFLLMRPVT
eukprot:c17711_g1_i2.p1 GENE.c17711_g1_i2~~c17711_g1_i2.p1  ORF type:complete len:145 (+),score=33.66 c17711_g1_i2:33-467(+)